LAEDTEAANLIMGTYGPDGGIPQYGYV
jgi:hypothetical protein